VKKRSYLAARQFKQLVNDLEAGKYSRFRIRLCTAAGCKNPIPLEDPVPGEPMTDFCSLKCYEKTTGVGTGEDE
jgi:hypothetical protein